MNKLQPKENPTAAFAKLRTWDWHSYPKDSIFILDEMNYHQLKFLQASNPDFRTDLIPIRKYSNQNNIIWTTAPIWYGCRVGAV